ncbi:GNAT family N-acetyltransferase [Mangrovicoccus algicola]|uniref:GNAT family N-acetyltransferase n=1 Tax=Mangrovicoccus algicola TaxID=2771008 RepID=A0A8J6YVJ2_9RHOB|nr:GNAT family N-acetyltransferase [Mangrovicoccus algicola]MBE3636979.1 GNAT family N-acetyltransferase [Mangrovicoccus algicola]
MTVTIRPGREADAAAAVALIRASITRLCSADHGDAPRLLEPWLANKTEAAWIRWARRPDAALLVAQEAETLTGTGMVDAAGTVLLLYVDPAVQFGGTGSALLARLEQAARRMGAGACRLESTLSARRFYESRGYRGEDGTGLRMSRPL